MMRWGRPEMVKCVLAAASIYEIPASWRRTLFPPEREAGAPEASVMRILVLLLSLVACAASASAGSRDAPEVPDAAGDCSFAAGNEYADMVAAWISEETATDFLVNIQLAKWTQDALGAYAGYTLQFTHQDVQWGVASFYDAQAGWSWSTAFIDTQSGQMSNFTPTEGAWDASTATMSILFPKSLFPHNGNDNTLRAFTGGSADFKKDIPVFIAQGAGAPVPGSDIMTCDLVQSSATYEFTLGQHTMQPAAPTSGPSPSGSEATIDGSTPSASPATTPGPPSRDAPVPPLALTILALACLAAWRRAR